MIGKNRIKYLLCLFVVFIIPFSGVNADNAPNSFNFGYKSGSTVNGGNSSDWVLFKKTNGDFKEWYSGYSTSTYGVDSWKIINSGTTYKGKSVFCVDWKKHICLKAAKNSSGNVVCSSSGVDTSKFVKVSSWGATSKRAVVTGYAVQQMKSKYNGIEEYERIGAMLNHYFRSRLSSTSSYKFESPSSFIKNYISDAEDYYTDNVKGKLGTTLSSPTISVDGSSKVLNVKSSGNKTSYYYSNKITFKNLLKEYGNSGDTVKYTIKLNNEKAHFCNNTTSGITSNCTDSISISGSTSVSYYVLVEPDVAHDTSIKITIKGSNSSKYYTSYLYKNAKYPNDFQRLLYPGDITVDRSTPSVSLNLIVPDTTSHVVTVQKVDTYGNSVDGAKFNLYINGVNTAWNAGNFSYKSAIVDVDKDPFNSQEFAVEEVFVPDGYIGINSRVVVKEKNATLTDSEKCYANDDFENAVDLSKCNNTYTYKCVNDSDATDIQELDNGSCDSYNVSGDNGNIVDSDIDNDTSSDNENQEGITSSETTYSKKCFENDTKVLDSTTDCDTAYSRIKIIGTNVYFEISNKRNTVSISKRGLTGDEEVSGAELKICKLGEGSKVDINCEAAKTVDGEGGGLTMEWTSGSSPRTWTGLSAGNYVIIETLSPDGYIEKVNQYTKFSIDNDGVVKSIDNSEILPVKDDDGNIIDYIVVVRNQLNSFSVSKQDIVTGKELSGASLTICMTSFDSTPVDDENVEQSDDTTDIDTSTEDSLDDGEYGDENSFVAKSSDLEGLLVDQYTGECISAILYDGTEASWESTGEAKVLSGLPAGTYYLVEKVAPIGYSTAESILFKMNNDGTLTDKDGKSIENNKLIMKDRTIEDVKTGQLSMFIVCGILLCSFIGIAYYLFKYGNGNDDNFGSKITGKIRGRKIHNV